MRRSMLIYRKFKHEKNVPNLSKILVDSTKNLFDSNEADKLNVSGVQ